jgi:fumarylacetoacetase
MIALDETHDPDLACAVASAHRGDTDFPIQNLPFGVFREAASSQPFRAQPFRGGVAIGDQIVDVAAALRQGWFSPSTADAAEAAAEPTLNRFAALGRPAWSALRLEISRALRTPGKLDGVLRAQAEAELGMPMQVGDYTDFYANIEHATNAGSLFRADQPILPNYRHVPIAYHGRASSIRPGGTPCTRPHGQSTAGDANAPTFGPSERLDFELELAFYIGPGNALGKPIGIDEAEAHIFGLCLLNDWSARDIQRWEYQPLGPFLGKNFQTNVSPWIVTLEALAPFRTSWRGRSAGEPEALGYLSSPDNSMIGGLDIPVSATLRTAQMGAQGLAPQVVSRSNAASLYWTIFQMLAHHTCGGCDMRPGDLVGTGTLSAPDPRQSGCLLEITSNGRQPLAMPGGEQRGFLEDGDEVALAARCERVGFRSVGFGSCAGTILPARPAGEFGHAG